MKICFSTLGCPDFEWPDVYSMAKDLGFDGIELRSYGIPADPYRSKPFTGAQLPKTAAKLRSLGLEIPCISSNCCLNEKDNEEQNRKELRAVMELAHALGAPYVRVLGDRYSEVTGEVDDAYVASVLTSLIPEAEEAGVTLLVETNGVFSNTKRLTTEKFVREMSAALPSPKPLLVGVITDPESEEGRTAIKLAHEGILDAVQFHGVEPGDAGCAYYCAARVGEPEDIAAMAKTVFEDEFVNRTSIAVDGGIIG